MVMQTVVIVSATRYNKTDFYSKSGLGRSISQSYSQFPIRSKIYFSNTRSLSVCYNDAISTSSVDDILIFVHDDVLLIDFFWLDKIYWGFQQFDILGLAGNKRRVPKQPAWAFIDDKFTWDDRSNLSGVVGHGKQFPCTIAGFGPPGQPCKLMDGVFLAAKNSILRKHEIQFDERFDFHFYDLDFCRQAERKNLRMGTIPLGLIHESGGNFSSSEWKAGYARYLDKWKE